MSPDQWLCGVVEGLTNSGAFVTVQPPSGSRVTGRVHVSQMQEGFLEHPSEAVSVGQEVKVRVAHIDTTTGRVSLSMRPFQPGSERRKGGIQDLSGYRDVSPALWFDGRIVGVLRFGIFVDIEPPALPKSQGMVHHSELKVKSSSMVKGDAILSEYKVGDPVKVRVVMADTKHGRLDLSLLPFKGT